MPVGCAMSDESVVYPYGNGVYLPTDRNVLCALWEMMNLWPEPYADEEGGVSIKDRDDAVAMILQISCTKSRLDPAKNRDFKEKRKKAALTTLRIGTDLIWGSDGFFDGNFMDRLNSWRAVDDLHPRPIKLVADLFHVSPSTLKRWAGPKYRNRKNYWK